MVSLLRDQVWLLGMCLAALILTSCCCRGYRSCERRAVAVVPDEAWTNVAILSMHDPLTVRHVANTLRSAGIEPWVHGGLSTGVDVPPAQAAAALKLLQEDSQKLGYPLQHGQDGYVSWMAEAGGCDEFAVGVALPGLLEFATAQEHAVLAAVAESDPMKEAAQRWPDDVIEKVGTASRPYMTEQLHLDEGFRMRLRLRHRNGSLAHIYYLAWRESDSG